MADILKMFHVKHLVDIIVKKCYNRMVAIKTKKIKLER